MPDLPTPDERRVARAIYDGITATSGAAFIQGDPDEGPEITFDGSFDLWAVSKMVAELMKGRQL